MKSDKESDNLQKDQETQRTLKGALFSLWAYDGNGYSKKIGNFQDMQDGSYQIKNISYTQTKDGWFLIKEERAPENYKRHTSWQTVWMKKTTASMEGVKYV